MKTVVIACGTGVATSTVVNEALMEILKDNKIKANVIQCRVSEIEGNSGQADLILTSMKINKDYGVPMLTALPILTGVGIEELEKKIIMYLR